MFTTNLQIHIVTCCIDLRIHHTSRIPYGFHSFSHFVVYVVTTLTFPKNQRQCASFSINVGNLLLPFKRATTAPNKLIDSQHYKWLRRKILIALYSIHSHISTSQPRSQIYHLVRSSFQTNDQLGTFKCACSRRKTYPFIHNKEKMSGSKRFIKMTDHFTCTSANVIYSITCTHCKKLYIGETGRRLDDRFR